MKKNKQLLDNVRFEVASEILAMKIALAIASNNTKEMQNLIIEQKKLYTYDEMIINKAINKYGNEIKKILKGKDDEDR